MLRLAFDFIITWRETRTRPNAYIHCATLSFISGNFSTRIPYIFYLYPANKTYDFHVHLTISPVSLVYICFLINLNLLTLCPNYL